MKFLYSLCAAALVVGSYAYTSHTGTPEWGTASVAPVEVTGPIVIKSEVVAELITYRSVTDPIRASVPRVVYGPFDGEHISETVKFDISAHVATGYRYIQVTHIQDGDKLIIQAKLGEPQILAFEPTIKPVKFEKNQWVRTFEFGRTGDEGDFITQAHTNAKVGLRSRLERNQDGVLTEAKAHAMESLQELFPEAQKIVIV